MVRSNSRGDYISRSVTLKRIDQYHLQNKFEIVSLKNKSGFPKPKTELGRRLLEHRARALARGMNLLALDEINAMVEEQRG